MNLDARAQAEAFLAWIETVSIQQVKESIFESVCLDWRAVARRLTPNPPSVLDLDDLHGFCLQILFWFPIRDSKTYGTYDTEDVHSHFGYIVTRGLIGTPYETTRYEPCGADRVRQRERITFSEGEAYIIAPHDIHSVAHKGDSPALSLRVVLPYSMARMNVYDPATGQLKETIKCGSENKAVELAGILATLGGFKDVTESIEASLRDEQSRRDFERLVRIADA